MPSPNGPYGRWYIKAVLRWCGCFLVLAGSVSIATELAHPEAALLAAEAWVIMAGLGCIGLAEYLM